MTNVDNVLKSRGGRGVHVWERMYTRGGIMSMYGKTNKKKKKELHPNSLKKKFNLKSHILQIITTLLVIPQRNSHIYTSGHSQKYMLLEYLQW